MRKNSRHNLNRPDVVEDILHQTRAEADARATPDARRWQKILNRKQPVWPTTAMSEGRTSKGSPGLHSEDGG